jgi:hypothetical protein
MHRFVLIGFTCFLALAWLGRTPLRAQELTQAELQRQQAEWDARKTLHRTLALGPVVGAGGTVNLPGASVRLEPAYGMALRYENPISRYFALGWNFGIQSWTTAPWSRNPSVGRNTVFDLALLAKLRYAIADKAEFYAGVPFGGVINLGSDVAYGGLAHTGVGWSIAGLLGARFALSLQTGFVAEVGLMRRSFEHVVVSPSAARYRITVEMLEPQLMLAFFIRT